MPLRLPFFSSIRLLQTVAIVFAAGSFSAAFAQAVPQARALPTTAGKAPATALAAGIDDELWAAIRNSDRAKVFEEYIRQYPDGRNVAQAESRLAGFRKTERSGGRASDAAPGSAADKDPETALWKVVFQSDNTSGYELFLRHYPKGKYALHAASRLKIARENAKWQAESAEQGAWQAAESAQTAEGYAAYLSSYPQGRYVALAQAQREKLSANAAVSEEGRLWQAAEKGGVAQLDAYLASYPRGRHASAAESRLTQLRNEEADMMSPGKVIKDCPGCPEMVVIPAGSFQMGETDAKSVHTVSIGRPFAMAKTEVTQSQWRAVMGTDPSKLARCDDCPVEGVSWNDAKMYVKRLSRMTGKIYRLPSEAEWEYACRAGGRQEYCGSDAIDSVAWHGALIGSGNSGGKPHPVGQKRANDFGLHDMSGNVSEWVEDCYHAGYEGGPVDGSAWITSERGSAKIPAAPGSVTERDECRNRVLRGGSWLSWPQHTRAAHRVSIPSDNSSSSYGFRPVWSLR